MPASAFLYLLWTVGPSTADFYYDTGFSTTLNTVMVFISRP